MSDTPDTPPDGTQAQPRPTADQLAQAAEQLRSQPAPSVSPPDEQELAAGLAARQAGAPAGLTEVDVTALLAGIKALQDRVDALEAEKAAGAGTPVVATAETLRDLLRTHAAHNPGLDHSDVLRLADDAADAAGNAAESGDGTELGKITGKLERAMRRVDPGPGDHHWYRQALGFIEVHLPEAAAALVPRPKAAPAVTSDRPPAQVVQGSVTG